MRFLFLSPVESFYVGNFNLYYGIAPPLGLLYLGKILEEQGDAVTVLDFSAEKFEKQKLINILPSVDAVGISLVSTSIEKTKEIVDLIKEADSEMPIIIGGPHCSLFPKKSLEETQADISIQGDSEKVILEIKKALNNEKQFSEIPGVFYRTKNKIISGPPFQPISDLDSIPFPARHLVKKYTYGKAIDPKMKKGEFTTFLTGRGCPFNCSFCSRGSATMQSYRTRSTENIIDEIREIHDMGVKYVAFMDDSFLWKKKRAIDIFDTIINENIEMKFHILASRVDSADKELYEKMKKAGVVSIKYGLESGNQDVLDFYNKKTTVEKIRQAVNLSHETGLFTSGTFIFGAPFETREHFEKTIKFVKSLPIDAVSFLSLRYMAGAELWTKAVKEGKIAPNDYFVLADSNRDLAQFTQKQIDNYCRKADREFYIRPIFLVNLFKNSLKRNDFASLQIMISVYLSTLKKQLIFWKRRKIEDFEPYQETTPI